MKKTIGEIIKLSVEYLKKHGVQDAETEAEYLLGWAMEIDRTALHLIKDQIISGRILDTYKDILRKRARRMPFSYITGSAEFYGMKFIVDENCLIPRQETEILVEEAIKTARNTAAKNILDIGCGCGNISVALAKHLDDVSVHSVDIQEQSLALTCRNAALNNVYQKITVHKGDLFSPFENNRKFLNFFDLIISNPPYIKDEVIKMLQPEVSVYEPLEALSGGPDGLEFYRRIIPEAKFFLKKGGSVILEIGYDQAVPVCEMLKFFEYSDIKVIKDYGSNDRVITAVSE